LVITVEKINKARGSWFGMLLCKKGDYIAGCIATGSLFPASPTCTLVILLSI